MKYQDYIEVGFKRTDMTCGVEFRETGYYGYCLEKKINKRMMVSVSSGDLDKPKLYIKKTDGDSCHIVVIPTDAVIDLFTQPHKLNPYTAC